MYIAQLDACVGCDQLFFFFFFFVFYFVVFFVCLFVFVTPEGFTTMVANESLEKARAY